MRVVKASYEIVWPRTTEDYREVNARIANAARTCYQSEGVHDWRMVRNLVRSGHTAMLEHATMTVRFVCDRGVSHEIVRHRLASYAQESTRYCNYSQGKFGNELTFVSPCFWQDNAWLYEKWVQAMRQAEDAYLNMLRNDCTPEQARSVLPNSVKTELVMTANMAEWRHFFKLRALGVTGKPHPQMAELAVPLLRECAANMPDVFGDLLVDPVGSEK